MPKRKVQHASPDVSVIQHTFGDLEIQVTENGKKYSKGSAHEGALLPKRKVQHASPEVSIRCIKASAHEGALLPKRKVKHARRMSVSYDIHLMT